MFFYFTNKTFEMMKEHSVVEEKIVPFSGERNPHRHDDPANSFFLKGYKNVCEKRKIISTLEKSPVGGALDGYGELSFNCFFWLLTIDHDLSLVINTFCFLYI